MESGCVLGLQVDVWAVGILAFELLVGKPPFEVDDEAHTVNMILTCNKIPFPPRHSPLWADFVRQALEKRPHLRPTATALLEHPCESTENSKNSVMLNRKHKASVLGVQSSCAT